MVGLYGQTGPFGPGSWHSWFFLWPEEALRPEKNVRRPSKVCDPVALRRLTAKGKHRAPKPWRAVRSRQLARAV
eukprot:2715525-Pyramimonas_sp.AAC.4